MSPQLLIDSHIHLWPESAANEQTHQWMPAVPSLAHQHSVSDYLSAVKRTATFSNDDSAPSAEKSHLLGYVYVETDRALTRECPWNESELRWLEGLCNSSSFLNTQNGHSPGDEKLLLGIVLWAPFHRSCADFEEYLQFVEHQTSTVWKRLKGFRYLVQGITKRQDFETLVFSNNFSQNLQACARKGRDFTFDVGIDQHSGGTWQLEAFARVIDRVNRQQVAKPVRFVLNHFCKPDLPDPAKFGEWQTCMRKLAVHKNVFIKLSGLISELPMQVKPLDLEEATLQLATQLLPWFQEVFTLFGYERCMWGSDWPVCNVNGPGNDCTWKTWHDVVEIVMDKCTLSEKDKSHVWWRTANEIYKLGTEE